MALGTLGIWGVLKNALSVLAYFFNPKLREKRDREKVWNEFKKLEDQYAKALAGGDPQKAAQLDKQMRELRAKYKYLNR